jgi:CBS-domain-containing membrane protein
MLVQDVMTSPVITTTTATTLIEAAQLMLDRHISGLPVVDAQNRVVGTLSEADLLSRVELGSDTHHSWVSSLFTGSRTLAREYVREVGLTVGEVMSPSAITVLAEESLTKAVSLMKAYGVKRLFVQREQSIVGVISRSDIVRALLTKLVATNEPRTDTDIQTSVASALREQPYCKDYALTVDVFDGVVTISGVVFDDEHRKAIIVTAERVPAVKAVVDKMTWIDPYSGSSEPDDRDVR